MTDQNKKKINIEKIFLICRSKISFTVKNIKTAPQIFLSLHGFFTKQFYTIITAEIVTVSSQNIDVEKMLQKQVILYKDGIFYDCSKKDIQLFHQDIKYRQKL